MVSMNDLKAGADVGIDEKHMQIHRGISFHTWEFDRSLGSGERLNLAFKTPLNKEIHVGVEYSVRGSSTLEIWEGSQYTVIDDIPVYNKNRIMKDKFKSEVECGPGDTSITGSAARVSGISGGTLIFTEMNFFESMVPSNFMGEYCDRELVLDKGTNYIFSLESNVANNSGYISLHWYELKDNPYRKANR